MSTPLECATTFFLLGGQFQLAILDFKVGFPTGRDSLVSPDKGTKVSSLSRDNGTMGQAQNLATGRDFDSLSHSVPGWDTGQKEKKRERKILSLF
jgi:hypothetical protein